MAITDANRPKILLRRGGDYIPSMRHGHLYTQYMDGRPPFRWIEVERMRHDPHVSYGLRILRAPLYRASFQYRSVNPSVVAYLETHFPAIWQKACRKMCRAFEYGCAAAEVVYDLDGGYVKVDCIDDFSPIDAKPLELPDAQGRKAFCGIRVCGSFGSSAQLDIESPYCLWYPGEAEYGQYWSMPRLYGAYERWIEKSGRNGAIQSRQHYFRKCAYHGGYIRYPEGLSRVMDTATNTEVVRNNEDIARQITEQFETGGVISLPSTVDQNGKYLWEWFPGQAGSEVRGILEYPDKLDLEILTGLGIVPEVVQMAEGGGGWSGRAFPVQIWYSSCDEVISCMVDSLVNCIVKPLIRWNFGDARFEVVPESMAEKVAMAPEEGQKILAQGMAADDGLGPGRQLSPAAPADPKVPLSLSAAGYIVRRTEAAIA